MAAILWKNRFAIYWTNAAILTL
ncbi:hypothetical protein JL09_g6872 [Pichia kudriavzevii]|uniref:Uncharacterized protein n=1 Tax=Pichia kudriavzevii TaxID=4909 RepID=A0A099NKQ5_PICKU|nr:hypothetical protein JL09_g6872 [Pichia kudriavzevii]